MRGSGKTPMSDPLEALNLPQVGVSSQPGETISGICVGIEQVSVKVLVGIWRGEGSGVPVSQGMMHLAAKSCAFRV